MRNLLGHSVNRMYIFYIKVCEILKNVFELIYKLCAVVDPRSDFNGIILWQKLQKRNSVLNFLSHLKIENQKFLDNKNMQLLLSSLLPSSSSLSSSSSPTSLLKHFYIISSHHIFSPFFVLECIIHSLLLLYFVTQV